MINNQTYDDLVLAARILFDNLKADINNASTRIESVRLTALAQEAENLYINLSTFGVGLVYTHSASAASEYEKQTGNTISGI